ncbi:hypothetical protein BJ912DRAFT_87840 [Pholiota molesta]|nr:hypothetical protein BJ912DRAFT_87840 [Pholiota molesta]
MSSTLPASPISKVNYDVLREIFVHCLPEHRLAYFAVKQPNIKVAPMLLCHVCSSWRTVALSSARLWTHLCYSLTLALCFSKETDKSHTFIAREVEFLQWWRKNQGAIPPFLRLCTKSAHRLYDTSELAQGGRDFVLEYAASAQYLELAPFIWTLIHVKRLKSKASYLFAPSESKLHTLVRRTKNMGEGLKHSFFDAQILFQPSNLRRISISGHSQIKYDIIPMFWSTLTHISVSEIEISLAYWFNLLDGLPKLEWAHFDIEEPCEHEECDPHTNITLPHLSTLHMAIHDSEESWEHVQISSLFTNVHLPAVRTLSLSWDICQPEHICCVAAELSAILKSAPAVTTLVLAEAFLEMAHPALAPVDRDAERHVEPIWVHAAHVAELRLEAPGCTKRMKMKPLIWDMLFTEGRWLDLQNMACPVRRVTIADPALGFIVTGDSDDAFMARIPIRLELAQKAPNITFRFTLQSGTETIEKQMEGWESSM